MIGTSDIHQPIQTDYDFEKGEHRTIDVYKRQFPIYRREVTRLAVLHQERSGRKYIPIQRELTAGFTSVDLASLGVQSVLVYIFLMWVGGAAQSTAGGIKVNAFAVVVLNLVAVLRGTERVEVFGRELSYDSIRRSNATVVMSISVLFVFVFILTIWEPQASVMALLFECVSALSTVGSSLNLTPTLGDNSKLLVAFLMFIGRVGLITLMLGIIKQKKHTKYQYPSGQIIIN